MKMYLDTNIILDWFRNIMISAKKIEEFKVPKKLEFISSQNLELFVSDITKAEIYRYLKSDWNAKENEIEEFWNRFLRSFNINYMKSQADFGELIDVCLQVPTRKKTLTNLLHLQLAKKENMMFLTGEKALLKKYKFYYDKVMSYQELRKSLSLS